MNLREMFGLRVPIISVVIGEGGSGGALAIGAIRGEESGFWMGCPVSLAGHWRLAPWPAWLCLQCLHLSCRQMRRCCRRMSCLGLHRRLLDCTCLLPIIPLPGCANRNLIMENSVYYVASPEACAAILWKSRDKAGTVSSRRPNQLACC